MVSPKNNNDTAGLTKNDTDGHKSLGSESEDMHTTEKLLRPLLAPTAEFGFK
jgi:hypothetical protein